MQSSRSSDWRPTLAWSAALVVSAGNLFLHLPISTLCDALYRHVGRATYETISWSVIALGSIGAAGFLLRQRLYALARFDFLWIALCLTVISVAAQKTLLVSNVEIIHFPQFALLAALLVAGGLEPIPAWWVTTVAGIGDEGYQYLVTYRGVPNIYLDFNDMALNAIGATWTVVLVASTRSCRPASGKARLLPSVLTLALLPVLLWIDPPRLDPLMHRAMTGRFYHVLSSTEGVLIVFILHLLVIRAVGRGDRGFNGNKTAVAKCLLATVLFAHGCGGSAPARPPVPQIPHDAPARADLLVTFWCGPPLAEMDDARAAEIAAGGFTVVGAPCEGAVSPELNRRALDVAARHGLRVLIQDRRIDECLGPNPGCEERLAEVVADFASHPALAGYFVVDEPGPEEFETVARIVESLHRLDPAHLAYVNLLPDFMPPEAFRGASYEEYVGGFLRIVEPRLLSYDHYPFKEGEDRPSFFANLRTIREQAQAAGVDFMLIVQAMPHGKYRDPTEAELSWQVFHALAFGARAISYFAYWTPVQVPNREGWNFRYGLVEEGKPTLHYFQAQRINRAAHAIGRELAAYRWFAVGDSRGEIGAMPPFGPIEAIDGGTITAGLFRDAAGGLGVLLVNRDYRFGADVRVRLRPGIAAPSVFDSTTGRWTAAGSLELDLAPGAARLIRFESANPHR